MAETIPHIAVAPRSFARIDRPTQRGVVTDTVEGYHAIWAAQIRHIPALAQTEQVAPHFRLDAKGRIEWLQTRQIQFLYALTQITAAQATFELRYIADPLEQGGARVRLVLLGKSFSPVEEVAVRNAQAQWERVRVQFPTEEPYAYPLEPITQPYRSPNLPAWQDESFEHFFWPVPKQDIKWPQCFLSEIRKFEDWPTTPFMSSGPMVLDYIVHPFVPPKEYVSMARLLRILASQRRTAFVSYVVRPVELALVEEATFARMEAWYRSIKSGELVNRNPAMQRLTQLGINRQIPLLKERATMGEEVYTKLTHERHALLLTCVRVVTTGDEASSLVETVRSELIANVGTTYPSKSEVCVPKEGDEWEQAMFNLRYMEMDRWRVNDTILRRSPDLARVRWLTPVPEAIAAFRLPTTTPGVQLPGMDTLTLPAPTAPLELPTVPEDPA